MTNRALAEQMARDRFADMMASAGVPHSQISLQVLYYLPPAFVAAYERVWRASLRGDDSGVGERGKQNEATGVLGKAKGSGRQLKGAGGKRRYKRHWTVRNEDALALKEKIDKRLRDIAREMELELGIIDDTIRESNELGSRLREKAEARRIAEGGSHKVTNRKVRCEVCGRYCSDGWVYCAWCGLEL